MLMSSHIIAGYSISTLQSPVKQLAGQDEFLSVIARINPAQFKDMTTELRTRLGAHSFSFQVLVLVHNSELGIVLS